ncbi:MULTISPECIES: pyridoxamine 5'-phosphate oxidase family protein [unclassified Nodularia (in: cyanobacteria)]|uniref:pyridoxamine 5'-phosphate oxidase family protein n=1 Tax=unclassified Nodularia (in: cyanobacteria) TaxID=2656917 RepID=UPI00187E569D|nr:MULTISPECIES: pyridoxamine 5'-phosphate oxidase family protein [unclassified Nodularia (in: cyanobacteria)]MBE9200685.1 pyridoxamine 5'-phosphate oxidase family protein [Nodularia sp. LEGE 06071]MCC2694784.1 pyridoxamine 5'-phosphate oxidase family protein [Nodularia sp. LEGE 04288]
MTTSTDHEQKIQQLRELIADIHCGMLTTIDQNSRLHSCPMYKSGDISDHGDGAIWFFTSANTQKADDIKRNQQVNVSFTSADQQRYVSVSGTAELIKDRNQMQQQWQPELQTWLPKGLDEPNLVLLKVNIHKVDYWDSPSSIHPQTIGL